MNKIQIKKTGYFFFFDWSPRLGIFLILIARKRESVCVPQIWSGDASSDSKHDRFSWPKVMRSISLITPEIPNKKIGIDPSVARLLQKVFTTVSLSFVFISERERERRWHAERESESFLLLLLPKQHTHTHLCCFKTGASSLTVSCWMCAKLEVERNVNRIAISVMTRWYSSSSLPTLRLFPIAFPAVKIQQQQSLPGRRGFRQDGRHPGGMAFARFLQKKKKEKTAKNSCASNFPFILTSRRSNLVFITRYCSSDTIAF